MRSLLFFCLLGLTVAGYPRWFEDYKRDYGKRYTKDQEHNAYYILKSKQQHIESLRESGLVLKLHSDSDVNKSYVNDHITNQRRRRWTEGYNVKDHKLNTPSHFDWRTHNYVNTPKRQGTCGGCFAFAAVGHLEFWYKKKTGKIRDLSIQQALDCSKPESDGCSGGLMEDVYYHSWSNPIGPAEFDPWKGKDRTCKHRYRHPYVKVHQYTSMSSDFNDPVEAHLARNIHTYGPIPVAVDSTSNSFELYHDGVLRKEHCGKDVDHAVLVVGYTPEYWIVKNSWGTHWGQNGYIYIERGRNACGINTYASFATKVSI